MSNFEIEFADATLRYRLADHPVAHTWARLAESYYENGDYTREELYQNFDVMYYHKECETLHALGTDLVLRHLSLFDRTFGDILDHRIYTRDDLNYLHSEYERIRKEDIPTLLPEEFNDQIHVCERFHRGGTIAASIPPRPRVRVRFLHKEWESSAPFKVLYRPSDHALFHAPTPGHLYACYCEVGKPPFSVWRDRDTVAPVQWRQFGPAFYVTFQNWNPIMSEFGQAHEWLEKTFGEGPYWMGEPQIGTLESHSVEEAFGLIRERPTIRGMRWT